MGDDLDGRGSDLQADLENQQSYEINFESSWSSRIWASSIRNINASCFLFSVTSHLILTASRTISGPALGIIRGQIHVIDRRQGVGGVAPTGKGAGETDLILGIQDLAPVTRGTVLLQYII